MGLAMLAGRYRCAALQSGGVVLVGITAGAGTLARCSPRSKNLEFAGLDQRLKRGVFV